MFMVDGAINRINVIFIPLVFYTVIGIINLSKVWFVPVITYFILFTFYGTLLFYRLSNLYKFLYEFWIEKELLLKLIILLILLNTR